MKIAVDQYETYEALILSGQMSHAEAVALTVDDPDFGRWYAERAAQRQQRNADKPAE